MLWQFRRELIGRLLEDGEVVISTPYVGHENDFIAMGCRCVETQLDRRGINPVKDFVLYRFYRKLIKEEKPDLVITYSIKPNIYGGYASWRLGIPYCVNVQGLGTAFQKQGIAQLVTIMYRAALKRARVVFFENKENARVFCKRRIISKERVVVLPGAGVNLDFFPYQPYPSEENGIHFLYLGRIMKEKGVNELFEAFRLLKEKYHDRVTLDLVGFFEEEYKEIVECMVRDRIVVFHGFQEDPRPYYAEAHCVVLPSYHEGMSNVLLEAAATGRALITTNIPGCKEAVSDGMNGYLCLLKNTESLQQCMERFVKDTTESRIQLGLNSRKHVVKMFDRENVVKYVIKCFRRILNEPEL